MYPPIIGVLRWVLHTNCDDKLRPYKQLNAEHDGKKAFAVNYLKGVGRSLLNLLDPETIKNVPGESLKFWSKGIETPFSGLHYFKIGIDFV